MVSLYVMIVVFVCYMNDFVVIVDFYDDFFGMFEV